MGVIFKNNVMYGAGNIEISPICYSEEEREIGVWTDGKPLYQKTIVLTGTYYGSTDIGNINISSPDTIIIISCAGLYYDNTWRALNFSHPDSNNAASIFIKTDGVIAIRCGSSITSQYPYNKIILNLQYTKTTDTPGSGIWTSSGAPAMHYSTNEQIVGTWTDGSTLYEKSYHVATVTSTYITIDNTLSSSTVKLRDVSMGSIVMGGAYLNAQYVDGRVSSSSFIRVVLNTSGLTVGMENPLSDTITDFDFTIRYTKQSSSQGGN